jgi:hypothetical protein
MSGPTLAPGAAFGLYALPSDDVAAEASTVIGSAEDSEYPAENLVAPTNTGHLNLPSRPAKLTTTSGYWDFEFDDPITLVGVVLVYPNFDSGLDVTIEAGTGSPLTFSEQIPVPNDWENDWMPSPYVIFDEPQTFASWRISINEANTYPVQIGRVLLLTAIRDLENDVRWGVVEDEEQGQIEHATEAGVELLYELFGPRRSFQGELALKNDKSSELITLYRSARNRILPWLLIPDAGINDAWFVRFQEPRWSRTREMIEHNIFPFRVTELSRGLPWP